MKSGVQYAIEREHRIRMAAINKIQEFVRQMFGNPYCCTRDPLLTEITLKWWCPVCGKVHEERPYHINTEHMEAAMSMTKEQAEEICRCIEGEEES